MTTTIDRWLLDIQGHRLVHVQGEFYVSRQGERGDSPMAVWIQFEGTTQVRLFGKSDGWGIGVDEAPPTGLDMGSAGRTVIQDMTKVKPFPQCIESPLQDAAFFTSAGSPDPVGV